MKFKWKCVSLSVTLIVVVTCIQVVHAASYQTDIWGDRILNSNDAYDYYDDDAEQQALEESKESGENERKLVELDIKITEGIMYPLDWVPIMDLFDEYSDEDDNLDPFKESNVEPMAELEIPWSQLENGSDSELKPLENGTTMSTNWCHASEEGCVCEVDPTFLLTCNRMGFKTMLDHTDFEATMKWMNVPQFTQVNLNFDENYIEYIPKFPEMTVGILSLTHNQISAIEGSAFSELKGLHSLDLSYNNLSCGGLLQEIFMGTWISKYAYIPLALRHLNLAHNQLNCIKRDAFDQLVNLKVLDLSHNPLILLSGGTGLAIGALRNLESLNLANTGISSIPREMFVDMQRLEWLDLSDNLLFMVPWAIRHLGGLRYLRLDSNNIKDIGRDRFSGLGNLETLSLKHSYELTVVKYGAFGPLRNLTVLDMSFCRKLEHISAGAFEGIIQSENLTDWKLKEIRLNNNALRYLSQSMCPWNMIYILDVSNNPFFCDCKLFWMLDSIIPVVERTSPEMVRNIKCTIPETMITSPLVDFTEVEIKARCEDGEFANFYDDSYFVESNFSATFFTIIGVFVGLIVILTVVIIVVKRTTSFTKDGIFSIIPYNSMKTSKRMYSVPE